MAIAPKPEPRPYIIQFAGTRFAFAELRFAIKRAAAISLGTLAEKPTYRRIAVFHRDTLDEETQLGIVIDGEYFPAPRPVTFEDLERAMVRRGFAFHLLNRATDRVQAEGRRLGMALGWDDARSKALHDAEDILREASERVADEMSHSERTAHYNVERLTER